MGAKHLSPIGTMVFGNVVEARMNDYGNAEWGCGLRLTEQESSAMLKVVEEQLAERRKTDPKFPATNEGLKFPFRAAKEKNEAGEWVQGLTTDLLWTINRKTVRKDRTGQEVKNSPPTIYDSNGTIVTDMPEVGFGSKIKVVYDAYIYNRPGNAGVKFELIGIQVVELKEAAAPIEIPAIEGGGWVAESAAEPVSDMAALLSA